MDEYEVSFRYDYATIVAADNLATDYEHALKEAKYWMESSGISVEVQPISTTVRKIEKDGEFGWQAGADECIVEIIEEVSA